MPVSGAEVIATRAPDRAVMRTRTDSGGRYEIVVDSGTGDYLLYVAPPGATLRAARRRVQRAEPSDTSISTDFALPAAVAASLAPIRVTVAPPSVRRQEPATPADGNEHDVSVRDLVLPPDAMGDVVAAGARLPGARTTGDGYSVLGAGSDQNAVTLNGLAIPATVLPREAPIEASVATTTYDPAIGWFGGAQTSVTLAAGRTFADRRASLSLDAPALQSGVRAGAGGEYTRLIGGMGGSGMTLRDRAAYSFGVQASSRRAPSRTLESLDASELREAGIAADSLARFFAALTAAGIPYGAGGQERQETRGASVIARLNTPERDLATYDDLPHSAGIILFGAHEATGGPFDAPFSTFDGSASSSRTVGSLQAVYSALRSKALLGEVRSGLTISEQRRDGGLAVPAGLVLLGAAAPQPGRADALTALGFGGGAMSGEERATTWHSQAELRLVSARMPRHRLKMTADLRYDGIRRRNDGDAPGSLVYPSLAALEAGRPASFSRVLSLPEARGGVWNGVLAAGDLWRPSRNLRLLFGVRGEATAYAERPAYNAALDAALGVRTDHIPGGLHVSPRFGFSWNTGRGGARMGREGFTRVNISSLGVVRGGIGEFRSLLGPGLVASRIGYTGLAGGARTLRCVGDAVPAVDWSGWLASPASIPVACADGAPALVDRAPLVQLVDRGYAAPRSWRANLAWGTAAGPLVLSAEGIVSWNLDQPRITDRNFAGVPRFRLADEGRDVFVPASSIDPSSGALASAAARRDTSFGAVRALASDGRSVARQLAVTVAPNVGGDPPILGSVTYVLGHVRELGDGFSHGTFGSPLGSAWARGDLDIRHSVDLQLDVRRQGWATLTMWGRLSSGMPFTPIVSGDVNGDGYANDRAFVHDPREAAADVSLRDGLSTLLATGPERIRRCLSRQLGAPARRNSCEGPWTATLDASLGVDGRRLGLAGRRATVTLYAQNVIAGVDRLVNGRAGSRWSRVAASDPVLLTVRGFDPAARRFMYQVNPRFGTSHANGSLMRIPFRVTLDVRVNLGVPYPVQQVERFLRPGRNGYPGPRLDVAALKTRYSRGVPDPYARVIAESDSLLLRPEQVRALIEAQRAFAMRADSAWTALARTFAALPDEFDPKRALAEQETVTDRVWSMARDEIQATLPRVLDAKQLGMLPYPASMLLETQGKVMPRIRAFF